jgi:NAD(P)-dependent dehydrogenase (short-subunit alcohol dehydrogenase family)
VGNPAGSMSGKTVFVTGATSGIGLETARGLARSGAKVLVGARDPGRGQAVVDALRAAGSSAELVILDQSSFASVRGAAAMIEASQPRLDVLVNNAGTANRRRRVTKDGHEETWQTNFLGGFLLTRLLLPLLTKSPGSRVVTVASDAHRTGRIDWSNLELERGYGGFRAYANTKLAQILFTRELARREPAVRATALHPGAIATRIWRDVPQPIRALIGWILPAPEKGAAPVVRLASAPDVADKTGLYFSRFREQAPSAAAQNDADARRLWETAERATGLSSREPAEVAVPAPS